MDTRDLAVCFVGRNRFPNHVDLRVQTLYALLEQIDPVDRIEQQEDDKDRKPDTHNVAPSP